MYKVHKLNYLPAQKVCKQLGPKTVLIRPRCPDILWGLKRPGALSTRGCLGFVNVTAIAYGREIAWIPMILVVCSNSCV